jgi:GTP-binding protein
VLVLNKLDQVPEDEHNAICTHIVAELGWTGPVFRTSGLTGEGTKAVVYYLMDQIDLERERESEEPDFAEAQRQRRQRLEQETRENSIAQREAHRAARRAAREAAGEDDDFDDWNEDDYDVEYEYVR